MTVMLNRLDSGSCITTTMPSVLVETGFITNPAEEKYLNSKEGQDYLASSIFRACRDYLNEIDSKSGISLKKNQNPDQKSPDTLPPCFLKR